MDLYHVNDKGFTLYVLRQSALICPDGLQQSWFQVPRQLQYSQTAEKWDAVYMIWRLEFLISATRSMRRMITFREEDIAMYSGSVVESAMHVHSLEAQEMG